MGRASTWATGLSNAYALAVTTMGATTQTVGRYVLEDLVAESAGSRMWRAMDPVLHRPVGVRLLPADDPRADALREAACLASQVTDTRVVRVLDVLDQDDQVAIITEWVPGRALSELFEDGMTPLEATRIARETAECLVSAHSAGIAHGRLRPNCVLVTDNGDIRLRGLGVEAVLWGCSPDDDPVTSDINGVGAVLYAGLTDRWPYGAADGIPAALRTGGTVPWPGRVAAELPAVVDEIAARSVKDIAPMRDMPGYTDMAETAAALRRAVDEQRSDTRTSRDEAGPERPRRAGRWLWRLLAVLAALLGIVGLAFLGWSLVSGGPRAVTPRAQPLFDASTPTKAALPAPTNERALPVLSVRDYDPLGNGTENADLAAGAIDRNGDTAWQTVRYRSDYLSGKPGVGLLLDLGTPRPINAVSLQLQGRGTDVEIRTTGKVTDNPEKFLRFASAVGSPETITLRSSTPRVARYVLVWITRIPQQPEGGYQGGITTVRVLG